MKSTEKFIRNTKSKQNNITVYFRKPHTAGVQVQILDFTPSQSYELICSLVTILRLH